MNRPFLKLTELTFKGDDLTRQPILVNSEFIAQVFAREIKKEGPVIIGATNVAQATIIKLNNGLGFHVEETPHQIEQMLRCDP